MSAIVVVFHSVHLGSALFTNAHVATFTNVSDFGRRRTTTCAVPPIVRRGRRVNDHGRSRACRSAPPCRARRAPYSRQKVTRRLHLRLNGRREGVEVGQPVTCATPGHPTPARGPPLAGDGGRRWPRCGRRVTVTPGARDAHEIPHPSARRERRDDCGDLVVVGNDVPVRRDLGVSDRFGPCGYLFNLDHPQYRAAFAMLDGAPRDQWEWSITLRRILYPLFAFPFMKVGGLRRRGIRRQRRHQRHRVDRARVLRASSLGGSRQRRRDLAARQLSGRHLLGRAALRERNDRSGVARVVHAVDPPRRTPRPPIGRAECRRDGRAGHRL